MKRTILLGLAVSVVGAACAQGAVSGKPGEARADERSVRVYEAVVRNLVGQADAEGRPIYIWERLDPKAASATAGSQRKARERLPEAVQRALTERMADLGRVKFVSDPESVMKEDGGIAGDGILIRVGPIRGNGDKVEVPAGWSGGLLSGSWMTLVLERRGGHWAVTGTTGAVAIA